MICPFAEWLPGPGEKTYGQYNYHQGIVMHSMAGFEAGAWSVLFNTEINPDTGRYVNEGSWHFSVMQDGKIYQHYSLAESPWHSGSGWGNRRYIGIEHEGGPPGNYSQPLTKEQAEASKRLVMWIAEQGGWQPTWGQTVFEHNQVSISPTSCPSNRIPHIEYKEDEVINKLSGTDAIVAVRTAINQVSAAVGQQNGCYVGEIEDKEGYRTVVLRVRDE